MRRAETYLLDMVEAADRIEEYLAGMTMETFLADRKTMAAVVREVEIVGEAARQVPEDLRASNDGVGWAELARLRNLRNQYIYAYHGLDYRLVWRTATMTIPRSANLVKAMLAPSDTKPAE
jgi:uncharacterized protein with HEPN domain